MNQEIKDLTSITRVIRYHVMQQMPHEEEKWCREERKVCLVKNVTTTQHVECTSSAMEFSRAWLGCVLLVNILRWMMTPLGFLSDTKSPEPVLLGFLLSVFAYFGTFPSGRTT
jgi:hypothetical protein